MITVASNGGEEGQAAMTRCGGRNGEELTSLAMISNVLEVFVVDGGWLGRSRECCL
jgi:hypothetical protein